MHDPDLPADLLPRLRARFDAAGDAGPPVTDDQLAASEARLGFPLPPPVRALYRVANGGAWFLGLEGGTPDDMGATAVDLYESFLAGDADDPADDDPDAPEPWTWRPGVLPILHWGCNTWTCVGCTAPGAPVIGRDGPTWIPDDRPLVTWLTAWAAGQVEQPG
jgi:hypothetical protein